MIDSYSYEFHQWEEAFAKFYQMKKDDSTVCLVISWNPYTSGYWVEHYASYNKTDDCKIYRSVKAIRALEKRVKQAIKESLTGQPGLIL